MTYPDAIQFLYSLRLFGTKFGLENTFKLAALAGNPQETLRFIHVAGTNGKGSTCAMFESIYRSAGLRTGLFTSPHLISFRERIQVNRQMIPEPDVVRLVSGLQPLLKQFSADHHPTFFEVITVLALNYFAEQKCDLVIWETGLGGRLDASNIVTPLASVITNISFDHEQWLGNTLAKIAFEKAGIIKPGVPVVTTVDEPEPLAVIEKAARERNAALTIVAADVNPPQISNTFAALSRAAATTPLPGDHQKINAALALRTVAVLQGQIPVTAENISKGLAAVSWPGRLQLITRPSGQRYLLDGAHNIAGASALRKTIEQDYSGVRRTLILGVLRDKDWRKICGMLAPLAGRIVAVPVSSERTADSAELAEACRSAHPDADISTAVSLQAAMEAVRQDKFVIVAGSLYLVGEALELLGCAPESRNERTLNEWSVRPALSGI